jgi:hypothetical protein
MIGCYRVFDLRDPSLGRLECRIDIRVILQFQPVFPYRL